MISSTTRSPSQSRPVPQDLCLRAEETRASEVTEGGVSSTRTSTSRSLPPSRRESSTNPMSLQVLAQIAVPGEHLESCAIKYGAFRLGALPVTTTGAVAATAAGVKLARREETIMPPTETEVRALEIIKAGDVAAADLEDSVVNLSKVITQKEKIELEEKKSLERVKQIKTKLEALYPALEEAEDEDVGEITAKIQALEQEHLVALQIKGATTRAKKDVIESEKKAIAVKEEAEKNMEYLMVDPENIFGDIYLAINNTSSLKAKTFGGKPWALLYLDVPQVLLNPEFTHPVDETLPFNGRQIKLANDQNIVRFFGKKEKVYVRAKEGNADGKYFLGKNAVRLSLYHGECYLGSTNVRGYFNSHGPHAISMKAVVIEEKNGNTYYYSQHFGKSSPAEMTETEFFHRELFASQDVPDFALWNTEKIEITN